MLVIQLFMWMHQKWYDYWHNILSYFIEYIDFWPIDMFLMRKAAYAHMHNYVCSSVQSAI